MTDLLEKLALFSELLHCAAPISLWHYDHEMNLVSCTSPQREVFHTLFTISEHREEVYSHCQTMDIPATISNHLSMVWLFAPFKVNGTLMDIYAIGPVFYTSISESTFQASVNSIVAAPAVKSAARKAIKDIPIVSFSLLLLFGTQLHFCLTGQHIPTSRIQLLNPQREEALPSDITESHSPRHTPYTLEQEIFRAVKEGNIQYSIPESLLHGFTVGTLSNNNPLRQAKNQSITFVILSSRAAIEGGLNPEVAYSLSDYYFQAIESAESINAAYQYGSDSYRDYIYRVYQQKQENYSREIADCMAYIQMNLKSKISLETVAATQGFNKNYLATRFKKETGCTIGDYITQAKIDCSKNMLDHTTLSISEIGHQLCFSSESHFSSVFRKITGMTPTEYKNRKP